MSKPIEVEITCSRCGRSLGTFEAVLRANSEDYEAPFVWISLIKSRSSTHKVQHVLNDRQDVASRTHGAVNEIRKRGGDVRRRHLFECLICEQSLPVRQERLWRALDRLAEQGQSSVDLDLLSRIVTLV